MTSSGANKSKSEKDPQGELKKIIHSLSLQHHEAVGYGNMYLLRDMVLWASIVLTTATLIQTTLTDTIGRYFTYYKLETVIMFK